MRRERIKIPGRWQLQRCDATRSASRQDDDTQVVLVGSVAAGRNSQAALGKVGVEVGGLCLDAVARWTNGEVRDERDVELHVREVGNAMGRGQEHRRRDEAAAADTAVDGTVTVDVDKQGADVAEARAGWHPTSDEGWACGRRGGGVASSTGQQDGDKEREEYPHVRPLATQCRNHGDLPVDVLITT